MKWSKSWVSSKDPGKKRKYMANASLHVRRRFISAHLSKELRKKYKRRSLQARKGDRVKVLRGQFKNTIGNIDRVDLKNFKVYVEGVHLTKREGGKAFYPLNPSNVMLIDLNLDDKMRIKVLERKK